MMSHLPFSYDLAGDFLVPFVLGKDDLVGENIANKISFSEARGHYWLWKNFKFSDNEFVALGQYRRCFWFFPLIEDSRWRSVSEALHKNQAQTILAMTRREYIEYVHFVEAADKAPLNWWLRSVDIVFSRPLQYPRTIAQIYGEHHRAEDWEIFAEACRQHGLDEGRHNWLTGHLMFIMRSSLFDEYMTLWWDIFSKIDGLLAHENDPYQHRKIGYLTERFVSAWLLKMRLDRPSLRIQTLPIAEGLFQLDREREGVM